MSVAHRPVSIPVLWVCFILSILSFSSCVDKIKTDIVVYNAADESLLISNSALGAQSETMMASLEDKMANPSTQDKATLWHSKAQPIQKLSQEIYSYIDGLKSDLKKEAGLKTNDGVESFKESDKNAVMRIFNKEDKGKELYEKLNKYKKDILAVDTMISNEFNNKIILTTQAFDAEKGSQDFTRTFFDDIPAIAGVVILSKFQNNVRVIENKMTEFCNNQVGWIDGPSSYTRYIVFATVSSSHVKPGEQIEIMSGIGPVNKFVQPIIIIDKKNVPLDEDGAAHYKFRASDKPGKHTISVDISYIGRNGNKQSISKTVEYTVAQ